MTTGFDIVMKEAKRKQTSSFQVDSQRNELKH